MQIPRFSPLDDDDVRFDKEEFQAGYDARIAKASQSYTATPSWRAGWADADAGLAPDPETAPLITYGGEWPPFSFKLALQALKGPNGRTHLQHHQEQPQEPEDS